MRKITALHTGKGRTKKVNVFLDGKFAFSLEAEIVAEEGLAVEQTLPAERIKAIAASNNVKRCYSAAARFLSYRPRSEPEIRERLRQRGFDTGCIEAVIDKLKRQELVDDTAFAQFWKENRETFSPRSKWLTGLELRKKGISDEIINQVVETIDDDESAYRAALKKAGTISGSEYQGFHRRLGDYLKRRGFNYGVIERTISRIWQDRVNNTT